MTIHVALAGNPNSGKTTLFNALTGTHQRVGNWPGVTVEKKEGIYKKNKELVIQDLPGIYSLSPYTLEEVVSREYLVNDHPDVILNIVDGTNLERNLYLTTQLMDLNVPMVVAVNMIDLVRANKGSIDLVALAKLLKCPVIEISALKGIGIDTLMSEVEKSATQTYENPIRYDANVEKAITKIEDQLSISRWHAIKVFERDEKIIEEIKPSAEIETLIQSVETTFDDDA